MSDLFFVEAAAAIFTAIMEAAFAAAMPARFVVPIVLAVIILFGAIMSRAVSIAI